MLCARRFHAGTSKITLVRFVAPSRTANKIRHITSSSKYFSGNATFSLNKNYFAFWIGLCDLFLGDTLLDRLNFNIKVPFEIL